MTKEDSLLKNLRKSRSLRVSQVATAIGVSNSHYYNLENGYRELTLENAWRIARYYGVHLDAFAESYLHERM